MNIEQAIIQARAWIASDPDPETRAELQAYVDARDEARLIELMSDALSFGTAGLRAIVGPGPSRMNCAVVRQTTAGVARYLESQYHGSQMPPIVVARDARLSSAAFMHEAVGVLAAHDLPVRYFSEPVATPLAAYAARRLGACACIVITASHNPGEYNGYKLYGPNAVQIVPPVEHELADEIARSKAANEEPTLPMALKGHYANVQPVADRLVEEYFRDVASLRPEGAPSRDLRIAYTPLHGVGASPVQRVFSDAGFRDLHVVAAQGDPDGHFPSVSFPNPEEPGALDQVTALARSVEAHLVLANDPDVDRLAASIPDDRGEWLPLSGNQIGCLLADFLLERAPKKPRPLVIQSIVSSPMLHSIAAAHGAHCEQTLTGFKWIWTAALELMANAELDYVFGYEEALGFSIGHLVRDKDGISAALILAELAALERAKGGSLRERLARLYHRHGLWVSVQCSVVRQGLSGAEEIRNAMQRLLETPPREVCDVPIAGVTDFRSGGERRPRWLGNASLIELTLGKLGRILVRPSGTEPKLKFYVDLCRPLEPETDVWDSERETRSQAASLADALISQLGLS
jgi:phosphomannomutase